MTIRVTTIVEVELDRDPSASAHGYGPTRVEPLRGPFDGLQRLSDHARPDSPMTNLSEAQDEDIGCHAAAIDRPHMKRILHNAIEEAR